MGFGCLGGNLTVHLLGLGQLCRQSAGKFDVIIRVFVGNGGHFHQFGSQQAKRVFLFLALCFRNDNHSAIAQRFGHQGEANAGVARGGLNDGGAGLQRAAAFCIFDHGQGDAVFDGAARVAAF